MKRDLDLCRRILSAVEASDHDPRELVSLDFVPEYNKNVVPEHVRLLDEAGLIDAYDLTTFDAYDWMPKRLTMDGHDFLDAARNDETWTESKRLLKQAGGASLKVLWDLLAHLGKQKLGLPD